MQPKLNICFCCAGTKAEEAEVAQMYDCVVGPEEWIKNAAGIEPKFKAIDLYRGPGFEQINRTVKKLRTHYDVTVWIFSAGWGILREDTMIPAYSATFSGGHDDKIAAIDQQDWILGVTQYKLPEGTVCCFPESYAKPYRRIWSNLDDMILIQGTVEDREDLSCSMIRTTTTLMEKIVDNQIEEGWDLEPIDWKQLRGFEVV